MASYTWGSTSIRPSTVDYGGVLFAFNGRDRPLCTADGSTFRPMHIPYHTDKNFGQQTLTAADSGSGGPLVGDYSWYIAYYNERLQAYGRPSPVSKVSGDSTLLTLASKDASLSSIPVNPTPPWATTLWDPNTDDVVSVHLFRNVAGAAIEAGSRPFYYLVDRLSDSDTAFTDDISDYSLDYSTIVPYGSVPCPAFKYSCIHNNRIVGVGFDRYNAGIQLRLNDTIFDDYMTTISITPSDFEFYGFIQVLDTSNYPLPDIFSPLTENLSILFTSGDLEDEKYECRFPWVTHTYDSIDYFPLKIINTEYDDTNIHKDGYYNFSIVETNKVFYYSQAGYPGVFNWGSPVYNDMNLEGYSLYPGDTVVGCASAGQCLLIFGQNSTSVHVNISDDPDLPNWIQSTIEGGLVSHWSAVKAEGTLFGLAPDGPVRFETPTIEQLDGGYFGSWKPADGQEGHRYCNELAKTIDLDEIESCQGFFNPDARTIEWTYTPVDDDTGSKQILYNLNYNGWYPLSGRRKLSYALGFEDGRAVTLHGDPWGSIQQDHTETIDGGDDELTFSTGVSGTAGNLWFIIPVTRDSSDYTRPNYLGGSTTGKRYVATSSYISWDDSTYDGPFGIRVYEPAQQGNGDWYIDNTSYQTIIDCEKSGSNFYLYPETDDDITYTYSSTKYLAVCVVDGYVDTPVMEAGDKGVVLRETIVRFHPVDDANYATLYTKSYINENVDVSDTPTVYEQPDDDGKVELIRNYSVNNGRGGSSTIRIGSTSASLNTAIKEIIVKGNQLGFE